ncbi:MAG TPA: DUF4124 domain-containing protein [Rhodanobacteraceae bacterium]|nr:DUF4124 domain-containing protein [Rhodanobacteraceae bacterium]
MSSYTNPHGTALPRPWRHAWIAWVTCAWLLWLVASGAHAASVYRCMDAHGHLAFQDTPCVVHAQQRKFDLEPQPLIGAPGEMAARMARTAPRHTQARPRRHSARAARAKSVMSWECRAADGEVFYRHTRCPSSIPGDGIVRSAYAEKMSRESTGRRHNAWSSVRVHGIKIPRAEACRRIHSAAATGRDGHLRDANVSTYDHLMGRDPCDME